MEHVRCQRSFDVDLSYRFWSCSICIQTNESPIYPPMAQATSASPAKTPVISIPTPENSQGGSPVDKHPTEGKQIQNENGVQFYRPLQSLYYTAKFAPESAFLSQLAVSTIPSPGGLQCLGLPARPAEIEVAPGKLTEPRDSTSSRYFRWWKFSTTSKSDFLFSSGQNGATAIADFFNLNTVKTWSTDHVAWFFQELGHADSAAIFKREVIFAKKSFSGIILEILGNRWRRVVAHGTIRYLLTFRIENGPCLEDFQDHSAFAKSIRIGPRLEESQKTVAINWCSKIDV